jgi:hypothetical protein
MFLIFHHYGTGVVRSASKWEKAMKPKPMVTTMMFRKPEE